MITIRKLQTHDNERYRKLWLYGLTEQSRFFRVAVEDDPTPSIPTKFHSDNFTLGAFFEETLVGIVSFERDVRVKLRHKALIFRMFVHPNVAGQGVGRALLDQLMLTARNLEGLRYVHLTVLASNARAIGLYASLNFKEYAREIGGVHLGDTYVDELQMACQL